MELELLARDSAVVSAGPVGNVVTGATVSASPAGGDDCEVKIVVVAVVAD